MSAEPFARFYHAAVGLGQNMLVLAGDTAEGSSVPSSVVEKFNVRSTAWQDPQMLGGQFTLPEGYDSMAVASDGERAYLFGGLIGPRGAQQRSNAIFCVNLLSLQCEEIVPAPTTQAPPPRSGSAMVHYKRKLVIYGGSTGPGRMSNELLVFDLDTKMWTTPEPTGDKPTNLTRNSLTMIDQQRAALFGGYDGKRGHSETYLLDLETLHWTQLETPGQVPHRRSSHAACCMGDPNTGVVPLMVVGGWSGHNPLSDVWLLDVTNRLWRQIILPTGLTERCGHSAVSFGTGPDYRVVTLFGGNISERIIAETIMLLLYLLPPPASRGGLWVADRVVGPRELGRPDYTLREQLKRLQITQPLSDEKAQEIIDKALESSSIEIRNIVSVITGLMGSGKTWLLSRLFNQQPPELYTSTGIAEQSFRGLLHHMMSLSSWEQFSHRNILEFLALLFREKMPSADVAQVSAEMASMKLSTPVSTNQQPESDTDFSPFPTSQPPPDPHPTTATGQSMVKLVKAPKSSQSLSMLELIHMIDTGGQPEYMESMPCLIQSCHLALLVLNLMYGLDEYPPVHFHEKEKAYRRALPSQHTNRQIIQKLASTLQAKRYLRKDGQCFRLLVVGTHKDCVQGSLTARVKAFDQALRDILLPACDAELIRFSGSEIPFVLNLKKPDDDDNIKLGLIQTKISESKVGEVINVPGSFLVFEQELVEFATKKGRGVVSFDECLEVGEKLKMKSDVVQAALIFFHHQITFLYFRHVLPDLVFVKPQLPLDFINAVVRFNYKINSGEEKGVSQTLAASLRDGIITEEILGHKLLSKSFIPNLYEPHHAIDLLCHTFTLAPLSRVPQSKAGKSENLQQTTSREKMKYLMMSLRPAIPDKELPKYIPTSSEIAPLLVKFSKDCVPLSCFSSTISCLLAMYDWRLSRSEDGSPECLAHNVVSLYDPQLPGQIILLDAANHLEVHIRINKGIDRRILPKICFHTRDALFSAITKVFDTMQLSMIEISRAFLCPCGRFTSSHAASTYKFESEWFLRCSKTKETIAAAEEKHKMWLDIPLAELDKPSLPKLLRLNIPEDVGDNFRKFGTFLLNDENGALMDAIENDCNGRAHRITLKVLQEWMLGKGERTTWTVLVKTLNDCKLATLASKIQKEYL